MNTGQIVILPKGSYFCPIIYAPNIRTCTASIRTLETSVRIVACGFRLGQSSYVYQWLYVGPIAHNDAQ